MAAAEDILVQRIVRSMKKMVARATSQLPDVQGGVVTQVSPLMVQMATSKTPAPAYGLTSYTDREIGHHVMVTVVRNELYVHGPTD